MRYSGSSGCRAVVIAVDEPDPDNLALVVYVCLKIRALSQEGIEVAGILLTGRPVGPPHDEKGRPIPGRHNEAESRRIQEYGAQRFYAHLQRAGITGVQIYDGGIAFETPIPDHIHFKSEDFHDGPERGTGGPLLPLKTLVQNIGRNEIDWIVGGPMTGVALALHSDPQLAEQTRSLHAMYGAMEGADLMSGEQFNFMVDRDAGKYVLSELNRRGKKIVLVPTNTTKDPELALDEQRIQYMFGYGTEGGVLADINHKWHKNVLVPAKQEYFSHDLAAGMAYIENEIGGTSIFALVPGRCMFEAKEGKVRMTLEQTGPGGEGEGPIRFRIGGGRRGRNRGLAGSPAERRRVSSRSTKNVCANELILLFQCQADEVAVAGVHAG